MYCKKKPQVLSGINALYFNLYKKIYMGTHTGKREGIQTSKQDATSEKTPLFNTRYNLLICNRRHNFIKEQETQV